MSEDRALKHEEWIARYGGELPIGVALEEEIVEQRGRAPAGVLLEEKIKRSKKGVSSYEVIFANEIKTMIFDGKALKLAIVNSFPPVVVFIFAVGLVIAYGFMAGTLPPPTAPLWKNMLNDIGYYMVQIQYLFLIIPSTIMSTNWFARDLRSGKLALIFSNPIDRLSFLIGKIMAAAVSFTIIGIIPVLVMLGLFSLVFGSALSIPLSDTTIFEPRTVILLSMGIFLRMVLFYAIALFLVILFSSQYHMRISNGWMLIAMVLFSLDWLIYVVTPDVAAAFGGGIMVFSGLRIFTINYIVSCIIDGYGVMRIPGYYEPNGYIPPWPETDPLAPFYGVPYVEIAIALYILYLLVTIIAAAEIWAKKDL